MSDCLFFPFSWNLLEGCGSDARVGGRGNWSATLIASISIIVHPHIRLSLFIFPLLLVV